MNSWTEYFHIIKKIMANKDNDFNVIAHVKF